MIQGRIISSHIFLKFDSGTTAMLSADRSRRLWQVDLLGQRARFYLALNTPLLAILQAIEGVKGGGR